jgi:hypothetical protein
MLMEGRPFSECCGLEDDFFTPYVVYMEQTEWEILRGFQKECGEAFAIFLLYSFHLDSSLACSISD